MMVRTLAILFSLIVTSMAAGRQHLVSAGSDWSALDDSLNPGDEIILMPGRHRWAELRHAQGTAERPITIRGLSPDKLPIIEAKQRGLKLVNPQHVVIRDVIITGASVNGVSIGPGSIVRTSPENAEKISAPKVGPVRLLNVRIEQTGPVGKRHALTATGVIGLRIESCAFTAWGGAAIELNGCDDVLINKCTFVGDEEHSQHAGIRIGSGSNRVFVSHCTFQRAGAECLVLGGMRDAVGGRPTDNEVVRPGSIYAASRVTVRRCRISGGGVAVTFANCDSCTVRNNTILRPTPCVFALRDRTDDPRFGVTRGTVFGSNLIAWETGGLKTLVAIEDGADTTGLTIEENLWWSEEIAARWAALGPLPGEQMWEQVTDVDPQIDKAGKPAFASAESFGADAP